MQYSWDNQMLTSQIRSRMPTSMGAVALLWAIISVGCSVVQPPATDQSSPKLMMSVEGLTPDWNLNEMIRHSDAVVIGTLTEGLGTKTKAGPSAIIPFSGFVSRIYIKPSRKMELCY